MKHLVIFFFTIAIPSVSWACKLAASSPWNWPKETLIEKSNSIVIAESILGENVQKRSGRPQLLNHEYAYEFTILEILKGEKRTKGEIIRLVGFASPFAAQGNVPRAYLGKDCEPIVGFELGKKYILFESVNHPWAYQEDGEKNRDWVNLIRKMLTRK